MHYIPVGVGEEGAWGSSKEIVQDFNTVNLELNIS